MPFIGGGHFWIILLVLAIRTDFGCLVIIVAFLIIMISTIVFADIVTPPAANPFV